MSEQPPIDDELRPDEAGGRTPPRRKRRRGAVIAGFIFGLAFLAIGWTKTASSDTFCGSCHEMKPSKLSAARSVHDGVPCIACHTRPGLAGAVEYIPSLFRESVAKVTGWDVAGGVLKARPCEDCHDIPTVRAVAARTQASGSQTQGHPASQATCRSCHGAAAHATPAAAPSPGGPNPHPARYDQVHGRDAAANTATCATCHQPEFCSACHVRLGFPHPSNWVDTHGTVQQQKGIKACTLCHAPTFCKGCHGTEIPHKDAWLESHPRAVGLEGDSPCFTCHPRTDCESCHVRHNVHRSQTLYVP